MMILLGIRMYDVGLSSCHHYCHLYEKKRDEDECVVKEGSDIFTYTFTSPNFLHT
jgi:hypothetical protein